VFLIPAVLFMVFPLLLKDHVENVEFAFEVISHLPDWVIIVEIVLFLGLVNWFLLSLGAATFSRERILTES
jgi:hypothetical protein